MRTTPRFSNLLHISVGVATAGLLACSSPTPVPETPPTPDPKSETSTQTSVEGLTFADQVARGGALYGANCAKCHGDAGQGTDKGPAVVGEGVLPLDPPAAARHRKVQFRTALDVFLWVKETMPADAPGSLTDAQYVEILAFDLKANGVELKTPLDAEVAKGLALH